MKKHFSILILLFFTVTSYTQDAFSQDSVYNQESYSWGKYAIGYSPSSYINTYFTTQISIDYRIKNDWNLTSEIGFIHGSVYRNPDTYGIKFIPGIEYVFAKSQIDNSFIGLYFNLRHTNEEKERIDNYPAYTRKYLSTLTKTLMGGKFMLGSNLQVYKNIDFQFSAGPGVAFLLEKNEVVAPGSRSNIFLNSQDGMRTYVFLSFNLNVSYRFG